MSTATLTESGRTFCAKAMSTQTLHIAWGSGEESWDEENPSLPSLVKRGELFTELGRRVPTGVGFVKPDPDGSIVIPTGITPAGEIQNARYTPSDEPTPYLYIRCNFDNQDASTGIIREMGLFGGTKVKSDLPEGQRYFTPDELEEPGMLIAAEIVRPSYPRSPSVRESYEFVLPF